MTEQKLFDISDDKLDAVLKIVYESPINITENMILERLRDRYRWPKSYNSGYPSLERIVKDDGLKEQDFFASDNHIQSHKVIKYYNEGYTFVLSGVQYLFNDIANITDRLSNRFGVEINSNIYISKGTKIVSYPYHDHNYAVIIKNIEGKSKWAIDGQDYLLEDQNVFFIDKFKKHCVKEIYDKKISITFNLC
jgi:hypothetical protein|tara:strand:+ start:257 stop:835 length:579 start_codon:yes stop_codon:yes gene_type:complete